MLERCWRNGPQSMAQRKTSTSGSQPGMPHSPNQGKSTRRTTHGPAVWHMPKDVRDLNEQTSRLAQQMPLHNSRQLPSQFLCSPRSNSRQRPDIDFASEVGQNPHSQSMQNNGPPKHQTTQACTTISSKGAKDNTPHTKKKIPTDALPTSIHPGPKFPSNLPRQNPETATGQPTCIR